jgi:lipopolysaccharide export LptBFGC system permease protein LptF
MTFGQLDEEIARLEVQGINAAPLKLEVDRRIAFSFSPFIFILIGLPLGITTRRAQRSIGFGISIVVFMGYYMFYVLGQALAQKELLPSGPAMWIGNIVFGLLGFFVLWRAARR